MDDFIPEVVPENRRNRSRSAALDTLEIRRAVVRHAASDRLAVGTHDVDAVAAIEGPLYRHDACRQERTAASHRGDGARIDVRGALAGETRENPSLAAFHPGAVGRESCADGLPFHGPDKYIVGRSACYQHGNP